MTPQRPTSGRIVAWAALAVMLAVTVVPLLVMLATALTPPQQLYARGNGLLPTAPTLLNFKRVLGGLSGDESLALGGSGAEV
ncbi:MAG: carbohydrate ABC transporter permease, partial [Burkholderiales bacterium]|nr:carbohydrate ABC transporter permease [Burkholderiales bacterium]